MPLGTGTTNGRTTPSELVVDGGSTYASALAAINYAYSVGGGTVEFGRVTIDLGDHYLPLKKGVNIKGQGYSLLPGSNVDDEDTDLDLTKGTVFVGNGTAPCFWDEKEDRSTPYGDYSFQDEFVDDMLQISIRDIGVRGGTYGIKVGANYSPGVCYGEIKNVMAVKCGWGAWFENCIHYSWDMLYCYGNTVGQIMWMYSAGAPLLCANTQIGEVVASAPSGYNVRGIEVRVRNATAGGLAAVKLLQSNKFYPGVLDPVAFTSDGAGNLTVPDGSKFFVDLPVYCASVGTTGLLTTKTYIVRSVVGNVITIGFDHRSTITVAAGSGTIGSYGRALLAVISETAPDGVTMGVVQSLDLEGWCTTRLLIDGQGGGGEYALNNIMVGTSSKTEVTVRNSHRLIFRSIAHPISYDFHNTAVNNLVLGIIGTFRDKTVPYFGILNGGDNAGAIALGSGGETTIKNIAVSGGNFTLPGIAFGVAASERTYTGGASNLSVSDKCDTYIFAGTANATYNWTQPAAALLYGYHFTIKNRSAYTLTFNLAGTGNGTIDGTGKTQVVLAPRSATELGGCLEMVYTAAGWSVIRWLNCTLV